ncbi:MAG: tetratricopeptide repeat protein [Firmicutes bacterium]|nr:tetratricopeptide repeat protein [Bacillota bacterium]
MSSKKKNGKKVTKGNPVRSLTNRNVVLVLGAIVILALVGTMVGGFGILTPSTSNTAGTPGASDNGIAGAPVPAGTGANAASNQQYISLVNAGNSYFDQGKFEQAVENYEKASRMVPDDPNLLVDLGTAYFYQKNSNPDKAIALYDRALQIAPNFRNGLYNKGVVLRDGKRDYAGAKAAWEQFLKFYPSGEQADNVRRWLGELRQQTGN